MYLELSKTALRPIRPLRTASLLGAICLATGLALSPAASAEIYLEDNFESSTFDLICGGNCPTTSTKYAREGSRSMRSYVNRYTSANSYRTEMRVPNDNQHQKMTFDRDYWIGFSTMLPPGWTHSGGTGIMAQIHHTNDPGESGGGPPFVIKAGKGDWVVLSRGNGNGEKTYTLNNAYEDVGRWVDWVIHYRPSKTTNGVLRVWKDGTLVVNQTGRSTTFDDKLGPRFSMGIYLPWRDRNCCDDVPAEKVVYHDALRMASGPRAVYRDVAPRTFDRWGNEAYTGPDSQPVPPPPGCGGGVQSDTSKDYSTGSYVVIENLKENQSVSGTVTVNVDAQHPAGIKRVVLWADDTKLQEKISPPYRFSFDSRRYSGIVRLKAVAFDYNDNNQKEVVRVQVNN